MRAWVPGGGVAGRGESITACEVEADEPSSRRGGVGSVPAITLAAGEKGPRVLH